MSDENRNPETAELPIDTPSVTPIDTPDAPHTSDALRGELDGLRDMFQKEWDRAVAESEGEPPIQSLEYEPNAEEEPEEETAETEETETEGTDAKEKKPKKKHGKALLIVLIVLLVLILIPLIAYFIISIKVPSFNNFMSAYTNAAAAKEPVERISYLEDALGYCEDGTLLDSMKQSIMEDIAVATCEASGYAAAKSYVETNFTDEMLAKPYSKEFKELLAVGDQVTAVADGAYDAVKTAYDKAEDKGKIDYGAVADALGTPALVREDVKSALGYLGSALAKEEKLGGADDEEAVNAMMTDFLTGVQAFEALGADTQKLLETAAVKLFDLGRVYETSVLLDNYFDDDMLAAPKTEAFGEMLTSLDAIKDIDVDVYAVALGLFENNTDDAADVKNALDLSLPDAQAQVFVAAAGEIIEGLKYEADKDLPKATESLASALNTLSSLELNVNGLCGKLMTLYMQLGDPQSAFSVRETLPDEIGTADEDLAATVKEIDEINAAVSAVEEVFYPYYYGYYYGTPIDKDALNAELDALLENEPSEYLTAYVSFFKFYGESMTTADNDVMEQYLNEFSKTFSAYPALYASQLGEIYRIQGKFDKAEALADEVLAVNAADDYANAIKSLAKRISLNVDDALTIAKESFERTGELNYSAREYLICLLLKEDYETAFDVAVQLYDNWLTYDNLEYVMIITSFYESDDAALQAKLDAYREKAEQTLDEAGVEIRETAQKLIDGKLTMVQVFLEAPYYLQ